jgi:hypothetical protein
MRVCISRFHKFAESPQECKTYDSYPLVTRSIKIVQLLELVFEPHDMTFNEWKDKSCRAVSQSCCTEKRNTRKILNICFVKEWAWGGVVVKALRY